LATKNENNSLEKKNPTDLYCTRINVTKVLEFNRIR